MKKKEKVTKNVDGLIFIPFTPTKKKKPFIFKDTPLFKWELYFYGTLLRKVQGFSSCEYIDISQKKVELMDEFKMEIESIEVEYIGANNNLIRKNMIKELKVDYHKRLDGVDKLNLFKKYKIKKSYDNIIYDFGRFLLKYELDLSVIIKKNGNLNVYGIELFVWFTHFYERDEDLSKIYDDIKEITELAYEIF